jgi:adenylate kinase family enzyme
MQRILVIGSSGAGRSTLSRRLSQLEQQLALGREAG